MIQKKKIIKKKKKKKMSVLLLLSLSYFTFSHQFLILIYFIQGLIDGFQLQNIIVNFVRHI